MLENMLRNMLIKHKSNSDGYCFIHDINCKKIFYTYLLFFNFLYQYYSYNILILKRVIYIILLLLFHFFTLKKITTKKWSKNEDFNRFK